MIGRFLKGTSNWQKADPSKLGYKEREPTLTPLSPSFLHFTEVGKFLQSL